MMRRTNGMMRAGTLHTMMRQRFCRGTDSGGRAGPMDQVGSADARGTMRRQTLFLAWLVASAPGCTRGDLIDTRAEERASPTSSRGAEPEASERAAGPQATTTAPPPDAPFAREPQCIGDA